MRETESFAGAHRARRCSASSRTWEAFPSSPARIPRPIPSRPDLFRPLPRFRGSRPSSTASESGGGQTGMAGTSPAAMEDCSTSRRRLCPLIVADKRGVSPGTAAAAERARLPATRFRRMKGTGLRRRSPAEARIPPWHPPSCAPPRLRVESGSRISAALLRLWSFNGSVPHSLSWRVSRRAHGFQ